MGRVTINFAEVEGGFEPVDEGNYPVIIEKVELRESKSSEHNYLNFELKISDGPSEGQRLWTIRSLSPKALFMLKSVFEALDVLDDEMTLDWDDDVEITPSAGPMLLEPDVIGLECVAVVTNEVYQDRVQNRVNELLPAGSADTPRSQAKATSNGKAKTSGNRRSLR